MQDCIDKEIFIEAPVSRVWKAVTDASEFSTWFGVKLESQFAVGAVMEGMISNPKYSHIRLKLTVETIEPETRFAYRWLPYALDPDVDYSSKHLQPSPFTSHHPMAAHICA